MTWFRVDDVFHSHPKVAATSLAARGLWVTAGSWSSAHLTDGVVPDHVLVSLGGTPELADELCAAGLWRRTRAAHKFHDWSACNPTKKEVVDNRVRKAKAGRLGGLASAKARSTTVANAQARASPPATTTVEPPALLLLTKQKAAARRASPTATRSRLPNCQQHQGQPAGNCALCRAETIGTA